MTDPVQDPAQNPAQEPVPESEAERELLLDVMGQQCPLPVLRARKRLLDLEPGALLRVFVTDPVSRVDMPHFCQDTGHELVETRDRGTWIEFLIRRGQTIKQDD